ncbi:protocatechuate 3,4-dioxygenase beta subunit [Thermocatellispora tengchongensis]|uniref:Protocatechuate 3,4-dioxygenase beta subunit n=1 Tax=Thermocatellispora tengchongensis TaxID=1073253 RepID=A0A840NWY4_9ACTN|nr:intradiol ring-cleavage dioxygenase [Thermocatellispora tengchongensis]MBB5130706.1 protocatechuate 3,4-dioxygenase beta subunit [Thermocatellispora tengchongensis]
MGHDHEGQRVSRRTALAGIGAVGLGAILAACSESPTGGRTPTPVPTTGGGTATITPRATGPADLAALLEQARTCTLTPATTQGPYYFDAGKIRSDIREDREGVRLTLGIKVQDTETCAPLRDAVVEIWHCDAAGLYSGAESLSRGGGGGPGDLTPLDDERYLRGAQVTGEDGIVRFTTIWPGWYPGRTVHIHAMVHISDQRVLTTQVMFDEALNTKVLAAAPYAARGGRDTFNDDDSIYQDSMLLKLAEDGDGYLGAIVFAADSADSDGGGS